MPLVFGFFAQVILDHVLHVPAVNVVVQPGIHVSDPFRRQGSPAPLYEP